ncbi:hypothetical protein [Marinomonas flavescens]|uniref:hypothetical protein n=1 Tax=Marinomonas flavescens TaxID=2529379 RepID=UPI001054817C|nr:hypothetical protein [Marinomonas flavescens]
MKTRTTILIPLALGLMVSACTTTTSTSSQGQGTKLIEGTTPSQTTTEIMSKNAIFTQEMGKNNQKIESLKQTLVINNEQLLSLQKTLDAQDKSIAALSQSPSDAESLVNIEKEKRLRESAESQYAELKIENDHLVSQIKRLEGKNTALRNKITKTIPSEQTSREFLSLNDSFQTLDSAHYALSQEYQTLGKEQRLLQQKYDSLNKENQDNQQSLVSLKKDNGRLGEIIAKARAQNSALLAEIGAQRNSIDALQKGTSTAPDQVRLDALDADQLRSEIAKLKSVIAAQKSLIADYQGDVLELTTSLSAGADNKAKIQALAKRLAALGAMNTSVNRKLTRSQSALQASLADQNMLAKSLASSQAQQAELQKQLEAIKAETKGRESQQMQLESQINNLIPFQAEVNALQSQINSGLSNVKWQVPNKMSLHNNFEILVTATVENPVAGQTYVAELVTDSAIQMVSASEAEAVLKDGQLQWRWRVSGLNERPKAKLNLFVSQQMNYQGQRIMRQVYRDSDTVALTNDDLFDKYGYWGIAILVGLLGGFLVGRINRKGKNS